MLPLVRHTADGVPVPAEVKQSSVCTWCPGVCTAAFGIVRFVRIVIRGIAPEWKPAGEALEMKRLVFVSSCRRCP